MLEEIVSVEQEENLSKKVRAKRRVRGLLICINAVLACYFIFEMAMKVVEYVKSVNDTTDYIVLYENSKSKSEELYDQYILKENDSYVNKKIYDIGLYGDYLHLSYSSITPSNYSSFTTIYPRRIKNFNEKVDVSYRSDNNKVINSNYLDGGLRLSSLDNGEYILFDDYLLENNYSEKHAAIKLMNNEELNQTIFTLPSLNGDRKKITIRSMMSSPALVVNVNNIKTLPNDYYDFVLIGEKAQEYKETINANYKVYIANSIAEACKVNANYCLVIDENVSTITGSNYLNNNDIQKVPLYGGDSIIASQDSNDYIRELGGHLTNAGSCLKDLPISFEVKPYLSQFTQGKYTLLINPTISIDNILNVIK